MCLDWQLLFVSFSHDIHTFTPGESLTARLMPLEMCLYLSIVKNRDLAFHTIR